MEVQKNHQLKEGTILDGRYEIGPVLGEGGFGITYRGVNINTGVDVAIKEFFCKEYMGRDGNGTGRTILTVDTAERRFISEKRRFLREARIVRDFQEEPGIVTVLDYFEGNETAYIVMERIDGTTLRSFVRDKGRTDPESLFTEMRPLMKSLEILHKAGVIHRDISPDNIIRTEQGRMVLIDFGSAKNLSSDTRTSTMTVKDGYTPPEQYQKGSEPSAYMDIYALSATLYFCLTGVVPPAAIQRVLFDELEPVSAIVSIPVEIDRLITEGMSLRQEGRPGSIGEMLTVIDGIYKPVSPEEKARKKRKKKITAAVVAGLLLFGAGFGAFHVIKNLTEYRMMMQNTIVTHYTWDDKVDRKAAEELKERVEAFAGKGRYLLTESENEITVEMPASLLGDASPDTIAEAYFAFPYSYCCIGTVKKERNENGSLSEEGKETDIGFVPEQAAYFSATDIARINISEEPIPIGETSVATVKHLVLTLKDSAAKDAADLLSRKGETLCFSVAQRSARFTGYSAGDGKTINVVDFNRLDVTQANVMVDCGLQGVGGQDLAVEEIEGGDYYHLLEHSLIDGIEKFTPAVKYHNEVVVNWELEDGITRPGKNQCGPQEIKGEFLLISYDMSVDSLETGDGIKAVTAFKKRLDALQTPYAFGTDAYDDTSIVVKIKKKAILQSEAMLLGAYLSSCEVTNELDSVAFDSVAFVDDVSVEEEGIEVNTAYNTEKLKKIAARNKKEHIDRVYLTYDSIPIAWMDAQSFAASLKKDTLRFLDLCEEGVDKDSEQRYKDFLAAVLEYDIGYSSIELAGIEEHSSEGSYLRAGSYELLDGGCYGSSKKLIREIEKKEEPDGAKVSAETDTDGVDIDLEYNHLQAEGFAKQAADFIHERLKRYTLNNPDDHIDAVVFVFRTADSLYVQKSSDPIYIKAAVSVSPNKEEIEGATADFPYRVYSSARATDTRSGKLLEKKSEKIRKEIIKELPDLYYPY